MNARPTVGVTGFEPATLSSRTIRATKLRHTPKMVGQPAPPGCDPGRAGSKDRAPHPPGGTPAERVARARATLPTISRHTRPRRVSHAHASKGDRCTTWQAKVPGSMTSRSCRYVWRHLVRQTVTPSRIHEDVTCPPVRHPFMRAPGTPNRVRTGVTAVRGRHPGPLDDGGRFAAEVMSPAGGVSHVRNDGHATCARVPHPPG